MWTLPSRVVLSSGVGNGQQPLNAFDSALLNAGIGDFNLIRVSSILPRSAKICIADKNGQVWLDSLPKGSLMPAVYTNIISNTREVIISSALAVGIAEEINKSGVIFECSLQDNEEKARTIVTEMVSEAFKNRGIKKFKTILVSSSLRISDTYGCALSAAVFLP